MTEPTPVERHWVHVYALRRIAEAMEPGPGKDRVQARYEAVLADHRKMVAQATVSE